MLRGTDHHCCTVCGENIADAKHSETNLPAEATVLLESALPDGLLYASRNADGTIPS